jgi:Tfp pilus assembly protein PilW
VLDYTDAEERARCVLLRVALEGRDFYSETELKAMLGTDDPYRIALWFLGRGLGQMGWERVVVNNANTDYGRTPATATVWRKSRSPWTPLAAFDVKVP